MTSSSAPSTATARSTTTSCRIRGQLQLLRAQRERGVRPHNLIKGIYSDYDLQNNPTDPDAIPARYNNKNFGLFVQDTWYVNSNLTPTFGLRGDRPTTSPNLPYNACFASARVANGTGPASRPNGGFGLDNSNTYSGKYVIQPRFGFNYTFDWDRPIPAARRSRPVPG